MLMLRSIISALYHVVMLMGSLWCHQRPERSPHIWGVQLPLCWRCSGILLGAVALFGWLIARKRLPTLMTSLILALLMPLDALTAVAGLWGGDNRLRLITGLLWGIFGTSLALHLARYGYFYSHRNTENLILNNTAILATWRGLPPALVRMVRFKSAEHWRQNILESRLWVFSHLWKSAKLRSQSGGLKKTAGLVSLPFRKE